jgi:uncharacterized protein YyaL (SSP411 family)
MYTRIYTERIKRYIVEELERERAGFYSSLDNGQRGEVEERN